MSRPRPSIVEIIKRLRCRGLTDIADDFEALVGKVTREEVVVLDEHELAAAIFSSRKNLKMTTCYEIATTLRAMRISAVLREQEVQP